MDCFGLGRDGGFEGSDTDPTAKIGDFVRGEMGEALAKKLVEG